MTIYEIYVYGEFHEVWESELDAHARVFELQDDFGDLSVFVKRKQIDFQEE